MALIMESAMALSTVLNNVGMATNSSELFTAWLNGLLAALPIALTLMVTISMTIINRLVMMVLIAPQNNIILN
ncbi:DUF2798 domain-containing protein [Photobacterium sanguinicancri]|uniref:DUF2798 domain-containing protein n=1 Tax=Photobacterium sanguinicancri TaxID=875932 RepID=A0AAW7Y3V3_9GAMM|nr:DUF2798 domain-containing protein [Photobacterium sanguinicancri]MDO6541993.1 DUF2798 domain-containing protein [Photobacterium sanguinicancri]